MTMQDSTKPGRRGRRFEYLGWALFLLGITAVAILHPPGGDRAWYWLAGGAAILIYVAAGAIARVRASLTLVFLGLAFLGYGALKLGAVNAPSWTPFALAGGLVLLILAARRG